MNIIKKQWYHDNCLLFKRKNASCHLTKAGGKLEISNKLKVYDKLEISGKLDWWSVSVLFLLILNKYIKK